MSAKSASQKAFSVPALLAVLALAALPLQAQAPRRPPAARPSVAATGEAGGIFARLWSRVARLGRPEMGLKEGMSIDPDGNRHSGATAASTNGDEGTSIDPNGRR